ncbi:MAG: hypothetical protein L3K17_02930 [Thermoplasmata archaeon]|nr:hypothetical protein [Thermoplasmata archaeon]
MVFIQDEGGVFDAPLKVVWEFLNSADAHTAAHRHREVRRDRASEDSGTYSWDQDFLGSPTRFTMRWYTPLAPFGISYDVLEGPLRGSKFFVYYTPLGDRTAVGIVGEFVSPTLRDDQIAPAVERFFALEFQQDGDAVRKWAGQNHPAART